MTLDQTPRKSLFFVKARWSPQEHSSAGQLFVSHKNKGGDKLKLNVRAFALTCGIIWGIGLFLLTWWIILFEGATGEPTLIGLVYRGFTVSPAGSIIGFFWALVDGLVGGAIFAWLYNLISARILSSES